MGTTAAKVGNAGAGAASGARFYADLPLHRDFEVMTHAENYRPLPDDWWMGAADIAGSTALVAAGRYRDVNTIGAAVICAQVNAIAALDIGVASAADLPFVFGGDGAVFAVPPEAREASRDALAAMVRWARSRHGVTLRAAQREVAALRRDGDDVRVARFGAGAVAYAMFEGGGARHLERDMKRGLYAVGDGAGDGAGEGVGDEAGGGAEPDLTGLSCRWQPVASRHGRIVSLIVQPRDGADEAALDALYAEIDAVAQGLDRNGHPIPEQGPRWPLVARGLRAEHAAPSPLARPFARAASALAANAFAWGLDRTGRRAGRFDPKHYARVLSTNADFRKISDGLMMTLDCDAATQERLRTVLEHARRRGLADHGMSEGDEAIVTCIVPSAVADDHIHFVDGAQGGYTLAAARMDENG